MQAGLVDQDMRHLRTVFGHVLHSTDALGMRRVFRIGHPKGGQVHPISFAFDLAGEPDGPEHLHAADVGTASLALRDGARTGLDDDRVDLGELGQLRGQAQPNRAGTSDQHIDLIRERRVFSLLPPVRGRL